MTTDPQSPKKVWLWWSSGKDSAWALHQLRANPAYEVVKLVTTVNQSFQRVAMHAVRVELLRAQAAALNLPLEIVNLPWPCDNRTYESAVRQATETASAAGVEVMAFGDLFLEEVRAYREALFHPLGFETVFPLWGLDTTALAAEMVASGLRAILTCVDPRVLDESFAGRTFDPSLLADLPASVDPCGEQGEFHTFAMAGPMFEQPLAVTAGERVLRDGFIFADLLSAE
ncbi:MAG: adenine nucleotide alpha hydrolase [Gammaproteobacteria bacterium]|nr:adenine nucleotide alpha hydrolase [Gammaproteobacteria bacterium]